MKPLLLFFDSMASLDFIQPEIWGSSILTRGCKYGLMSVIYHIVINNRHVKNDIPCTALAFGSQE